MKKKDNNQPAIPNTLILTKDHYPFISLRYRWYKRAMLSGILSFAALGKWNRKETDLLTRLALIHDEPLVSPRACLGLIWSLLNSYDTANFKTTIKSLKQQKENQQLVTFLILAFEATVSKSWVNNNIAQSSKFSLNGIEYLEPFSENTSYHKIDKAKFSSLKQKREFFRLLSSSLSLSQEEKERVFLSVNRLRRTQIEDLIRIFHEERDRFLELSKEAEYKVTELAFKRGIEDFMNNLSNFPELTTKLEKLLKSVKQEKIALALYEVFQSDKLLKYLQFDDLPNSVANDAQNMSKISRYLMANHRYKEAKFFYKKILNLDPDNFSALFNLGFIQSKLNYKKDAIKYYKKALQLKPKDADTWYNLGVIYKAIGNNKQALKVYQECLRIDPNETNGWVNLAIVQYELDLHDESIKSMQKAVELNPNEPKVITHLARLYRDLKFFNKSRKEYEKALYIQPDFQFALTGRAWLYFTNKKYKKAREYFIEILEDKMDKHNLMNLGHCELIIHSEKSAVKYYEQSLDLWECSEKFFEGMKDDFQYIDGISEKKYNNLLSKLRKYCKERMKK